jgi:(1->4)-alpha-D-glucan 1-alpha-D-glucosylmutase
MVPFRATVRLQLHAGFTFDDARAQLDYYADLGISHLYLSPIARAVDGSTHGYDVIDPTVVNPALGGEPALQALAAAARGHGMGLVLDIVPNHVAAHPANPWWADVLANGHHSRHADWFDINWRAPGRGGKLWLPVLGQPLPAAIAAGEVAIQRDADGVAGLVVHGQRYPLAAQTQAEARPGMDAAALAALLDAQAYRLAWWRSGDTQINYRRFFTIASLAALQVERDEVFDAVHALPLRLAAQGVIDGVRVDHVDGLRDPGTYLQRLRTALDVAGVSRGLSPGALGLWVEKILAPEETLPPGWACDGSTGYDFMDQVAGVMHDAAGGARLLEQ